MNIKDITRKLPFAHYNKLSSIPSGTDTEAIKNSRPQKPSTQAEVEMRIDSGILYLNLNQTILKKDLSESSAEINSDKKEIALTLKDGSRFIMPFPTDEDKLKLLLIKLKNLGAIKSASIKQKKEPPDSPEEKAPGNFIRINPKQGTIIFNPSTNEGKELSNSTCYVLPNGEINFVFSDGSSLLFPPGIIDNLDLTQFSNTLTNLGCNVKGLAFVEIPEAGGDSNTTIAVKVMDIKVNKEGESLTINLPDGTTLEETLPPNSIEHDKGSLILTFSDGVKITTTPIIKKSYSIDDLKKDSPGEGSYSPTNRISLTSSNTANESLDLIKLLKIKHGENPDLN